MNNLTFLLLATGLTLHAATASADQTDPAAARAQLEIGYSLKKSGKYEEALEHLLESLRLDSQLRTLINIADCEEQLGKLVSAQQHWVIARDNAGLQGNAEMRREAEARLAALESRLPRITITLAGAAPPGTEVLRDGIRLGDVSLGTALPADPGQHVVVVRAPGHQEGRYEVALQEREQHRLDVVPGPELAPETAQSAPLETAPAKADSPPADRKDRSTPGKIQRIAGLSAAGLGVVSLGAAGVLGLNARSQHEDAVDRCRRTGCDGQARSLQSDAESSARFSTIAAIAGGVLAVGGVTLYLTAPKSETQTALIFAPFWAPESAGLVTRGRW